MRDRGSWETTIKDIEVVKSYTGSWLVKATTDRFGEHAIMFESYSFKSCIDYLKQHKEAVRHQTTNIQIEHPLDEDCRWLIRRYPDGHYTINSSLFGKPMYTRYERISIDKIEKIFYQER